MIERIIDKLKNLEEERGELYYKIHDYIKERKRIRKAELFKKFAKKIDEIEAVEIVLEQLESDGKIVIKDDVIILK